MFLNIFKYKNLINLFTKLTKIEFLIILMMFGIHISFISLEPYLPIIWSITIIYLYKKKYFYVAINSYIILLLFLFADKINFGIIGFRTQMAYSSLMLLIMFSFIFLFQELSQKISKKLILLFTIMITIILYSLPLFYIIYSISFHIGITKDIIYAMNQTNFQESLEFAQSFLSLYWLLLIIFLVTLSTILLTQQSKMKTTKIKKSTLVFLLFFMLTNVIVFRNKTQLFIFLKNATTEYEKALSLFKNEQDKMRTGKIVFHANKDNKGETYIVIIGESLNKYHMGIYGYDKKTTPYLSAISHSYLKFNNSYSNHTHTMPVLSLALTEANQLNNKSFYNSLSIINILNKANFETYWVSNQNMYGRWDNLVSIIAHQTDHLFSINHASGKTTRTQKYDAEVLKPIKNILSKYNSNKNKIIFVHLIGSHTNYCGRYPSEFKKFNFLNGTSDKINCYDNSVLYNDYVIYSILKLLKSSKGIKGLIYMSDHGEDIDRGLGHNSSKFTYDMTQIPLIMWFSPEYKEKYPSLYKNLNKNINKLFSNDLFYDSLLGIMQVNTQHYNSKYDLSSSTFMLKDSEAYTLHGKRKYVDVKNLFYTPKK